MNEIILANAALELVTLLIPRIQQAVTNGQITVEAQQALREKYNALRAQADAAFTGPEWTLE